MCCDFRGRRIASSGLKFEACYVSSYRIDVISDQAGTAASGLDKAGAYTDEGIEHYRTIEREISEIQVPEFVGILRLQG
jgi:hypothetical protein